MAFSWLLKNLRAAFLLSLSF